MTSVTDAIQIALKHHQAGQLQKAESIYHQILQDYPDHPDALHLLGGIAHQMGNNAKAADLINKAILNNPKDPNFYFNLGVVLNALEKWKDAIIAYQHTIRLKSDYFEAWNNLGNVLREHGQLDDAIEKYKNALQLRPDSAETWNNLGNVLKEQGRCDDAIEKYKRALQLRPDYAEAWNNLASVMLSQNQFQAAIKNYRHALQLKPDYAVAWNNMGGALEVTGDFESAIDSCRQALRCKPDYVEAYSNLLFLLSYNVLYSPTHILEEHRNWDRIHGGRQKMHTFSHTKSNSSDKRLKIGYVSPDLRQHAVCFFFEPILKNHDRSQIEVFCYAGVSRPDAVTERLKMMVNGWRTTAGMSDEKVAQMIYDDKIDILIDLAGHTQKSRLKVFTYKPAPVQATYLGYCTTTGLKAMDYWITDMALHPKDTIELAVETIIRLPRCWVCYQPSADTPDIKPSAFTNNSVMFGSFNNLSKITHDVIRCWSQLLNEVSSSRLILKTRQLADPFIQERILKQFAQHGVDHKRVILLPRTPSYMADYNKIDIALDTFPRTGGVTTADALWMGVPVITLAGRRYIERQGVSMLKAVGLEELIASTLEDYITKTVALAKDFERLIELKTSLRERMANSPLCNGHDLTKALENAYRKMWHTWCESKQNDSITGFNT